MAALATVDRHPLEASEMMKHLGIDLAGGILPRSSLRYAAVFRQCGACMSKGACREWLGHPPAGVKLPPRFCPSADILFELEVA
jgi:hypothetical protein